MKVFYNLPEPYDGLRGRCIARKGRLLLFKIFQEDYAKCEPFWLIYIQNFKPSEEGAQLNWFIGNTRIVSTAPGKHHLQLTEAEAHFDRLSPFFKERKKREVSAETLQHFAIGREKLRMKKRSCEKDNGDPDDGIDPDDRAHAS